LANNYVSECGIKEGFARFSEIIHSSGSFSSLNEEDFFDLQRYIEDNSISILEKLFNFSFPLKGQNSWKNYNWKWNLSFTLLNSENFNEYSKLIYEFDLKSTGWISKKSFSSSLLKGELEIFIGNIPLSLFPVLVEKKKSSKTLSDLEVIIPDNRNYNLKTIYLTEEELIPSEDQKKIFDAFNIKYFYPYKLSYLELRRAIGLELIDEPIPPGVYLIHNDLGLGGVYVEGDLKEMILAIEENYQVIGFYTEDKIWLVKFSPELSKTIFITPDDIKIFNLIPRSIIIVNGKIHSLTAGLIDSKRELVSTDEEIPCILSGVNLNIISSDEVKITSHLILQGVEWKDGIPYIKENKKSQLIIFSTGKDFFDDEEKSEGGVIIESGTQDGLKLQASLIVKGKGIKINGKNKNIQIFGSVQTSDINSNGNSIKVIYDQRLKDISNKDYPLTISKIIFLSDLRLLFWKDYK
jgi:hypothetical protein